MALSLNELTSKTIKSSPDTHNALRQAKRPWQGIENSEIEATSVEEITPVTNYSEIARTAVEHARQIVEKNELMLNDIYGRRIGKDLRSLAQNNTWDKNDEQLFYLHDFSWEIPEEKKVGAFSKIKKLFTPRH